MVSATVAKKKTAKKKAAKRAKRKAPPTTGGRLPFLLFLALLLGVAAALVIEVQNYIDYPSIDQFESPGGKHTLTIYHRGSSDRRGQVLIESAGAQGQPIHICEIRYADAHRAADPPSAFEELRWSGDGTCLVALRIAMHSRTAPPEILWIYDTARGMLFMDEDAASQPGSTAGSQPDLVEFLASKGGKPDSIVTWYDLGKKEGYLFSWQTTKWDRVIER